jgi:hypothetical protein
MQEDRAEDDADIRSCKPSRKHILNVMSLLLKQRSDFGFVTAPLRKTLKFDYEKGDTGNEDTCNLFYSLFDDRPAAFFQLATIKERLRDLVSVCVHVT